MLVVRLGLVGLSVADGVSQAVQKKLGLLAAVDCELPFYAFLLRYIVPELFGLICHLFVRTLFKLPILIHKYNPVRSLCMYPQLIRHKSHLVSRFPILLDTVQYLPEQRPYKAINEQHVHLVVQSPCYRYLLD